MRTNSHALQFVLPVTLVITLSGTCACGPVSRVGKKAVPSDQEHSSTRPSEHSASDGGRASVMVSDTLSPSRESYSQFPSSEEASGVCGRIGVLAAWSSGAMRSLPSESAFISNVERDFVACKRSGRFSYECIRARNGKEPTDRITFLIDGGHHLEALKCYDDGQCAIVLGGEGLKFLKVGVFQIRQGFGPVRVGDISSFRKGKRVFNKRGRDSTTNRILLRTANHWFYAWQQYHTDTIQSFMISRDSLQIDKTHVANLGEISRWSPQFSPFYPTCVWRDHVWSLTTYDGFRRHALIAFHDKASIQKNLAGVRPIGLRCSDSSIQVLGSKESTYTSVLFVRDREPVETVNAGQGPCLF